VAWRSSRTSNSPPYSPSKTGINDPRYASLRGIRQAQQKEIAAKTLANLGLDPGVLDSDLELTTI